MFRLGAKLLALALLAATLGLAPGAYGIPSFADGTGWLNGGVDASRLQGKVVLVDFWEYTCINCLRTLPYLKAWYERYHNDGLVIVGVHTPEFAFSGEQKNVAAAVQRLGVSWPVVLDTNDEIWRRYGNSSWPQEYLFDQDGKLVHVTSGEGEYQETEARIQSLLKARNPHLDLPPVMALLPQDNYTKPGAVCYMDTPEVLLERTKIADAGKADDPHRDSVYTDPGGKYADGRIYLQGTWHMTNQAAVTAGAPGYLLLPYHAIQVVGVMAPPGNAPVRVDVTQDGAPVAKGDAGSDIRYDPSGASYVTVDSSRAYELLMNAKMAFHDLRLTPETAGLGIYSFAFESCEIPKQAAS